jgi:hypothetical protein
MLALDEMYRLDEELSGLQKHLTNIAQEREVTLGTFYASKDLQTIHFHRERLSLQLEALLEQNPSKEQVVETILHINAVSREAIDAYKNLITLFAAENNFEKN